MKQEIREYALKKRNKISNKKVKDENIVKNINFIIEKYNKIMLYYPISSEPNILEITNNKDKKFYLPYCNKKEIEVRYFDNLNNLIKDDVNIYSSKIKTNDQVEVVIAPAVACNKNFYRLGYGGGYYDRFLYGRDVIKIMVVYDELIIEESYQESFDVPFDYIVTEKEILKRK